MALMLLDTGNQNIMGILAVREMRKGRDMHGITYSLTS